MNQIDVSKLSVAELKALVYDHLAIIENSQRTVQQLNGLINQRSAPAPETPKEEPVEEAKEAE